MENNALLKAFEDFKSANDARLKLIEEKKHVPAELEQKLTKIESEIERLEKANAELRTAANRTSNTPESKADEIKLKRVELFRKFLKTGDEAELKTLSVASDPDGGYLVIPEMSDEIVQKVFESSPVRQYASIQTISSDSFEIIHDLDEAGSGWVSEQGARPATSTPQFKKVIIPTHELYAFPFASQKILDDAFVNLESWIASKVADKFARDEATAFVNGDGNGKPRGFLTYAAGAGFQQIEQVAGGAASAIEADGLIDLVYALKSPYRIGAAFMMKRQTVAAVRKLKDQEDQYLWRPGIEAGQPSQLLGYPVVEAEDMPAVGTDSLSVAFGNFQQGYQIVDRFGIRVLRDPYTSKPLVGFYTTKRVGGDVKNFEAIKILKTATSV
jgi:HK97 family phage major capsid protein